ncbi:hypothetical protein IMZ48_11610 [Candidatus Bathyarchaeota archaeon]|nr:hypothetical protein [Candidatus Bathyarchaeota archaeon]
MSPAQIAQLRNMIVEFVPVGFNLFQEATTNSADDDGPAECVPDGDSNRDRRKPNRRWQIYRGRPYSNHTRTILAPPLYSGTWEAWT